MSTPKHADGTLFLRYKNVRDGGNPDTSSPLVLCRITGTIWEGPELGWVYSARADEPVENMDANWNTGMDLTTATFDSELAKMKLINGVYTP